MANFYFGFATDYFEGSIGRFDEGDLALVIPNMPNAHERTVYAWVGPTDFTPATANAFKRVGFTAAYRANMASLEAQVGSTYFNRAFDKTITVAENEIPTLSAATINAVLIPK